MKKIILSFLLITAFIHPQSSTEWATHFEKSGFMETPRYTETIEYFQKLSEFSEFAQFDSFGISPQGRNLNCVIVSKDKLFNPAEVKRSGKPVLLIINGIHAGEIGGKDACMLLLRDILVTKEKFNLINNIVILVVPIFNVDGHEKISPYNRINQNGPEEMGWRTTAQNINLNRDWLKADALEMQAMLKLFSAWIPDFLIDTHCTDGADYQYTVTYAVEKFDNIYSGTAEWLKKKYVPSLEKGVNDKGFLVHPYVYLKEWRKGLDGGIVDWAATPRFSTGYCALQNRPSLLIETHMLKTYKERVYSTKAMIETTLEFLNLHPKEIIELNKEADEKSIKKFVKGKNYLPVSFTLTEKFKNINFKGFNYYWDTSYISGSNTLVYTNEKKDFKLKYFNNVVAEDSVKVPTGYFIPEEWEKLVSRLKLHGVIVQLVEDDTLINVKRYKFKNVEFAKTPYEGKHRVSFDLEDYYEDLNITAGSYYIPTNQTTLRVIVNSLEPKLDDSFVKWGFMNQIFEQKEYYENYVMEKIALQMITEDPDLKKEFEAKLQNEEAFKNNPQARLDFFFKRSPYYDSKLNIYPIAIVE